MAASQFQNINISPSNPYRVRALNDPNGDGMRMAQQYEVQNGGTYTGAPGVANTPYGAGAPVNAFKPGWTNTPDPAATSGASSSSGTVPLGQIMSQPAAPSAPAANPFAGATQDYLNTPAPAAPKAATLAPNQYAGDLSAADQRMQDLINNPSSLQDSASYKFRVQQGQEALQRSLGAKGMLQSGNRLQALTDYGQQAGSQEYEAENARRKAMYDSASSNFNANQNTNVAQLGIEQGSLDKNYATAGSIYGQRGQTIGSLYGNADTAANNRYATDVGAATAKANTIADLYRTDTNAAVQREATAAGKITQQPWWTTKYDAYGRPLSTA